MQDFITQISPYYIYIKFVHVIAVMAWVWSTSVAYAWYVRVAWKEWKKDPSDDYLTRRKNWVFEQFDQGASLEHVAFIIILVTGPMLYFAGHWDLQTATWLKYKLMIVIGLVIPIEIFDTWISHLGGNKTRIQNKKGEQAAQKMLNIHEKFLFLISPVIVTLVFAILFLAMIKPHF